MSCGFLKPASVWPVLSTTPCKPVTPVVGLALLLTFLRRICNPRTLMFIYIFVFVILIQSMVSPLYASWKYKVVENNITGDITITPYRDHKNCISKAYVVNSILDWLLIESFTFSISIVFQYHNYDCRQHKGCCQNHATTNASNSFATNSDHFPF